MRAFQENMGKIVIPEAVFDQHVITLGKTRSGKSSAMRYLVEHLLDEKKPVCIVDPKGDWWGIKSSATGKSSGYSVTIFGGEHGDLPLNASSGSVVAELAATENRPSLIDLGGWMPGDRTRFWIDFASTFFRMTRGRRWLAIDEVHNFCPKGKIMDPNAGKMLHWSNRLASEGLGKGVALIAASQRPQKVHNDFLTSCETLVGMRVIHKADRDAIKDWIDACGDVEKGKEVLNTIASRKRGEAWVYSPEINFGPEVVTFPMFSTYDSFKPQDSQHPAKLKGWAEVDLEQIKSKLETVVKEAEANDPAKLKARIRELERDSRQNKIPASNIPERNAAADAEAIKRAAKSARIEYERLAVSQNAWAKEIASNGAHLAKDLARVAERAAKMFSIAPPKIELRVPPAKMELLSKSEHMARTFAPTKTAAFTRQAAESNGDGELTPYQRDILRGLAELRAIGRDNVPSGLAAAAAGKSHKSSTWERYIAKLNASGLTNASRGRVQLTEAGLSAAPPVDAALDARELQTRLMRILTPYQRDILKAAIEAGGEPLHVEELAQRAGKRHESSTFERYLASLSSAEILERVAPKTVRAAEWLFLS